MDLSADCKIHFEASPEVSEKEVCIVDLSDFSLSDIDTGAQNILI